jgi:hypothetical protein
VKTKQQIIDDGQEAARLLRDTDLKRFWMRSSRIAGRSSRRLSTSDRDAREDIYMKLRGVQAVRQKLRAMEDNATIEKK